MGQPQSNPLINRDYELHLLAAMMRDATVLARLATAYPTCASNPEILFGSPDVCEAAGFLFTQRQRTLPAVIRTALPKNAIDFGNVYDNYWSLSAPARWKDFAKTLRELSVQRGVIEGMKKHNWREPIPDILSATEQLERDIRNARGALLPYDPSAKARVLDFNARRATSAMGRLITVGVNSWDNVLTDGVRVSPGEATVLHGRPKSFKTTLMLNIMVALARKRVGITHISAERGYSIDDLVAQYLQLMTAQHYATMFSQARLPKFDHTYVMNKKDFEPNERQAYDAACAELSGLPIYMYARRPDQGGTGSLDTALGWARLDRETRGTGVVLFDNFQSYREKEENDYDLMNRVVPPVTELQSEYGLALFAIAQENESGQVRGSPVDLPSMINNEMKVEVVGVEPTTSQVKVRVTLEISRFRASQMSAVFTIHTSTGMIIRDEPDVALPR